MADTIKFLKVRDVKSPGRAYDFDAGIDFYVPEFTPEFIKDLKEKNPAIWPKEKEEYAVVMSAKFCNPTLTMQGSSGDIKVIYDLCDDNDTRIKFDDVEGKNYFLLVPGARILIPSGIKTRMVKPGRALIAFNKSGIATKHGLIAGACVVDYLYQGEIHLSLINTSTKVVRIYAGMKILQFVETPVFNSNIEILEKDPHSGLSADIGFYKGMNTDRGEAGFDSTQKK